MRYRKLDDEWLWECTASVSDRPCGLCDQPIRRRRRHLCCLLCADETGGSYHKNCLRRAGAHVCRADDDAPLTAAELASNETAVVRTVERTRFQNDELARWIQRHPWAA